MTSSPLVLLVLEPSHLFLSEGVMQFTVSFFFEMYLSVLFSNKDGTANQTKNWQLYENISEIVRVFCIRFCHR